MPKVLLNQIIAVEKTAKNTTHDRITELHRLKPETFVGLSRIYTPKDEDGDQLPEENKIVQNRVPDVLNEAVTTWSNLLDVILTKEAGNQVAVGQLLVDDLDFGKFPVSFLLSLEKTLEDVRTFVDRLPTLDPTEVWEFNAQSQLYMSKPTHTHRTQKTETYIVVEGSGLPDKGIPPETKLVTRDELVGLWTNKKLSGGISYEDKRACLSRIAALRTAVKFAREKANSVEVEQLKVGEKLFNYIFNQ